MVIRFAAEDDDVSSIFGSCRNTVDGIAADDEFHDLALFYLSELFGCRHHRACRRPLIIIQNNFRQRIGSLPAKII